jgi:hypothetical protein
LISQSRGLGDVYKRQPIHVNIAVDGIAGIRCGEYFHIDGIPEMYNKNGIFQITNVKQGISNAGWQTTIEATYRTKIE